MAPRVSFLHLAAERVLEYLEEFTIPTSDEHSLSVWFEFEGNPLPW